MGQLTRPFFIVSSGRSGTKMMERLFSLYEDVEMHHEYMVHHIQPVAARYEMGLAEEPEVRRVLLETHSAAVHYSEKRLWGDASNKLSWIIPVLDRLFPEALFIHLVRDGRKVTSSYFHKLTDECYDDASTEILSRYIESYPREPAPPPEKPYWWPQPPKGSAERRQFLKWSQFERIAWHWALAHQRILEGLTRIEPHRQMFVRLEDLVSDPAEPGRLLRFLGLPPSEDVPQLLTRPHNINRPEDHFLTDEQTDLFWKIAGETMRQFGYDTQSEYAMNY